MRNRIAKGIPFLGILLVLFLSCNNDDLLPTPITQPEGKISKITNTYESSAANYNLPLIMDFTYNGEGNVALIFSLTPNGTIQTDFTYINGLMSSKTSTISTSTETTTSVTTYAHNSNGQLMQKVEDEQYVREYSYNGDIISVVWNNLLNPGTSIISTYAFENGNSVQIEIESGGSIITTSITYDSLPNLLTGTGLTMNIEGNIYYDGLATVNNISSLSRSDGLQVGPRLIDYNDDGYPSKITFQRGDLKSYTYEIAYY